MVGHARQPTNCIRLPVAAYHRPSGPRLTRTEDLLSAASAVCGESWGRVALSVPEANLPRIQPLRHAFELRGLVNEVFTDLGVDRAKRPSACAAALVIELARVHQAIDPGIVLRIVLETVNGMAKMAPMTERHMREAKASEASLAP